jgi:DivIVA domain-containing protein
MLTITELTDKTFTTTRLREGYEIAEVDAFVAEVRETLVQQERELDELRNRPAAPIDRVRGDGDPIRESSVAAARLLEMATVNADQLVCEAKAEAASLVAAANDDAEQITSSALAEAGRVSADLERHRESVLAEVAGRKAALEARVDDLQRLEAESRERLRGYFTDLLAQVQDSVVPVSPVAAD